MNILDPIFYCTLFYDFSPVISPRKKHTSIDTLEIELARILRHLKYYKQKLK
jgi:hypothetical protein